ncbi:hypothetical protein GlitD10_2175 [Gloeomargarita lithophora Alchichica-D10]|uniref:Capsule polysaccharide biosynthesis protein n=1 Tax=Gloeomargarita lithophora Alchichica-D10 TaxID=1188229 RepID=A0A1J0AF13_9CYAN|nr:hypothetical protein [Gloeomargarita lithophora]APB34504.1 hypothetical protein GlitD10_2175 [Gloeomargarita lithophora Alchichica-D10]
MKKLNVCIVSHDAGAAEIIASYVAQNKLDSLFVLAGPAIKVFERRIGEIEIVNLESAIAVCDWCLCGTSSQSDLEWQAIRQARDAHKRVVVFLDHWVSYRERFIRQEIEHLPDEIWVGDSYAQTLASQIFLKTPIKAVNNPYFQDIQDKFKHFPQTKISTADELKILYVCEPIDELYYGYSEHDAFAYFMENLAIFGRPVSKVTIRPHPSESLDKYQYAQDRFGDLIVLGGQKTLIEEISQCSVVVGCETMAMIVGLLANRRVISCIPPGGRLCALPHQEIEHLSELL